MSDMNLKVTPAELEAKAADFKSVMTQTKSLTDDMMNDVTGLSSSWTGDASASYINKFRKLQTDMDTMGGLVHMVPAQAMVIILSLPSPSVTDTMTAGRG